MPFNYPTKPFDPKDLGVLGSEGMTGLEDTTPFYVGLGNDNTCSGLVNSPAYILIAPENPGAYVPCTKTAIDTDTPRYLQKNPKLKWVATTGAKVPRAISTKDTRQGYTYNIARVKSQTNLNGKTTSFATIGTYIVEMGVMFFNNQPVGQISVSPIVQANSYEILTCQP
jgi:hypothetical protein